MYNRYIPRSDGSYQRSPMPEAVPRRNPAQPPPGKPPAQPPHRPEPAGAFLRQLFPQNFDTADLIIVLLLLLLGGDSPEDRDTAMLTLALYLFM